MMDMMMTQAPQCDVVKGMLRGLFALRARAAYVVDGLLSYMQVSKSVFVCVCVCLCEWVCG